MLKTFVKSIALFITASLVGACNTTAVPESFTPRPVTRTTTPVPATLAHTATSAPATLTHTPTNTISIDDTNAAVPKTVTPESAAGWEPFRILQGDGQIVALGFSPDDCQLTSLTSDFTLKRWDVISGEEMYSQKLPGEPIYNGAISPLGDVFAVEGPGHVIQLRDIQEGQVLREMPGHTAFIMSLVFSSDGQLLATGDENGSIMVWETGTGLPIHTLAAHPSPVGALAFSPDKAWLASGGVEGSEDVKIWNMASGEEIRALEKHAGNVYDLAFSPDGTLLASASGDRTLILWEVASGRDLQTFRGHPSNVYSVDFSPDGKLLASGDFNGNIKLWEIASGRELNTLTSHTDLVKPVRFAGNGLLLASGSFDSTIVLWGAPGEFCPSDQITDLSISATDLTTIVPVGTPVALDGLLSPGEWDGGLRQEFTDGGELFLLQDGGYLYLGIHENFDGPTVTSVFMEYGNKISVFHSSGSLGTAIFEYTDDYWPLTQPFGWELYGVKSNTSTAENRRQAFLERYGWLANLGSMTETEQVEYKILLPDGPFQIAVAYLRPPDFSQAAWWPAELSDDTINIDLLKGNVAEDSEAPLQMHFAPETWAAFSMP